MVTYQLTSDPLIVKEIDAQGQIHWTPASDPAYQAWASANTPSSADPKPITYSGDQALSARLRTTDATPTDLYRRTLAPTTAYTAVLSLIGVDAGNGAVRQIRASIVAKRLGGGAVMVGPPVVIANHQDAAAASWGITAQAAGNDLVVTCTGAAGRTIDWILTGQVTSYTPGGQP